MPRPRIFIYNQQLSNRGASIIGTEFRVMLWNEYGIEASGIL